MNRGADTPTACGPGVSLVMGSLTGFSSIMTVEPRGSPTTRMPPLSPVTGAGVLALSGARVGSGGRGGAGAGIGAGAEADGVVSPFGAGVLAAVVSRKGVVSAAEAAELCGLVCA